jgi:hypothetical protein
MNEKIPLSPLVFVLLALLLSVPAAKASPDPALLLRQAQQRCRNGDYQEAETAFLTVVHQAPGTELAFSARTCPVLASARSAVAPHAGPGPPTTQNTTTSSEVFIANARSPCLILTRSTLQYTGLCSADAPSAKPPSRLSVPIAIVPHLSSTPPPPVAAARRPGRRLSLLCPSNWARPRRRQSQRRSCIVRSYPLSAYTPAPCR